MKKKEYKPPILEICTVDEVTHNYSDSLLLQAYALIPASNDGGCGSDGGGDGGPPFC